ncbi:unnamed protein product [Prunus armeniaca]
MRRGKKLEGRSGMESEWLGAGVLVWRLELMGGGHGREEKKFERERERERERGSLIGGPSKFMAVTRERVAADEGEGGCDGGGGWGSGCRGLVFVVVMEVCWGRDRLDRENAERERERERGIFIFIFFVPRRQLIERSDRNLNGGITL